MAYQIRQVDYFYTTVPDKPGEGARVLSGLRDAGVNLVVFSGFPAGRKGQLDFVPSDAQAFVAASKKLGLQLSGKKRGFLVQGEDQPGAAAEIMVTLGTAGVNVVSLQAICSGEGHFGAILWVKPPDVKKAARALGIS